MSQVTNYKQKCELSGPKFWIIEQIPKLARQSAT